MGWAHMAAGTGTSGSAWPVPASGCGRSAGTRAYVDRFDAYLDDVAVLMAGTDGPHVPLVVLGHSMGGLIALACALSDRPGPDLLVLSAPALDADISAVKRVAARILGGVPGVERIVFDGFRHESFNEEGGAAALETVVSRIERHL